MTVIEAVADDALECIILRPTRSSSIREVVSSLKSLGPDIGIKRAAQGVVVSAFEAYKLDSIEQLRVRWSDEAWLIKENRRKAVSSSDYVTGEVRRLVAGGVTRARHLVPDPDVHEILDDHQLVNVAAMTLPETFGLCVFDEQGAGKTVTTIYAFDRLVAQDRADFLVVVAPKNMLTEWPRDFARFTDDLYRVAQVTGTRREKRSALGQQADVVVTNFETAVAMEAELKSIFRRHQGRGALVVDESFYVKNRDAKRTRALRRIREYATFAYVLCGTPAPNRAHDVVEQCNLVDFGMTFRDLYQRAGAIPSNDEIRDRLADSGIFLRHLKSDVLPDLPGKSLHRVYVPMGEQQRKLYEDCLLGLLDSLRETSENEFQRHRANFLARRSALLQICSNPRGVDPKHRELPAKLATLDELLQELIAERGEKVVLWSFYTRTIDSLIERYDIYSPVRLDGKVSDLAERRTSIDRFQNDNKTMLFVANPAAAGAGLTLHRARISIYESMSNQAAHYLQSLDRIHRRGQERDVEYIILLCEDSLETLEFDRLTSKERSAGEILGDCWEPPFTRDILLRELSEACDLLQTSD